MIVDNIVIELPDIEEKYVLALLASIQAYEKNAFDKHAAFYRQRVSAGSLELHIILVRDIKYAHYDFLWQRCLKYLAFIHDSNEGAIARMMTSKLKLTSHVVLSYDVAADICRASRKHLAQGFGIILGSENDSLPDVSGLIPNPSTLLPNVLTKTSNQYALMAIDSIINASKIEGNSLYVRTQSALQYSGYIGEISFESYLMSCIKRPVFEISFGEDIYLLSKWSNANYFHSASLDKASIDKGIGLCLNRISMLRK